jgi:hypothetical protein
MKYTWIISMTQFRVVFTLFGKAIAGSVVSLGEFFAENCTLPEWFVDGKLTACSYWRDGRNSASIPDGCRRDVWFWGAWMFGTTWALISAKHSARFGR